MTVAVRTFENGMLSIRPFEKALRFEKDRAKIFAVCATPKSKTA